MYLLVRLALAITVNQKQTKEYFMAMSKGQFYIVEGVLGQ